VNGKEQVHGLLETSGTTHCQLQDRENSEATNIPALKGYRRTLWWWHNSSLAPVRTRRKDVRLFSYAS
jgi:hypothetical protein